MTADPVTIIVDDWDMTDKQDQVGKPGGWSSSTEYPGIFNNTVTFPDFTVNGSFIYKFEGDILLFLRHWTGIDIYIRYLSGTLWNHSTLCVPPWIQRISSRF